MRRKEHTAAGKAPIRAFPFFHEHEKEESPMPFAPRPMRSLIFVDCVREEYRHRLLHWL